MKSILQNEERCYICGSMVGLERHHIMAGVANRRLSERYGIWVYLCHKHHVGDGGAQYDIETNRSLKRDAQLAFEADYGHDEWMKIFRKNYL